MISKEKYILDRVIHHVDHHINENIDASLLKWLIEQWSFDYEMNKEFYPEVLINK